MRRFKIFTTIFVIYEFVMVIILHRLDYCVNFFELGFCEYENYKYVFMCALVPALIMIFMWWLSDIMRLFCHGACNIQPMPQPNTTMRDVLKEIISPTDLERFITTAVIMGIQKFSKNHPKTADILDDILTAMQKPKQLKRRGTVPLR